ncbi:MAG: ATP-binding protein, partial [Thiohalomonadales bacterium]
QDRESTHNLSLEINRDLQKANAKLKMLDRQKTHFFQNISHELRTPLTLLLNPLDTAYERYKDDDIRIAIKNAKRLLRLVNQLLNYQSMTVGKKQLKVEPIGIEKFLESCTDYIGPICRDRDIHFQLINKQTNKTETLILAELDALEKIVFNYLSNALKYTPRGGNISLILDTNNGSKSVKISVVDSGPGISSEDQSKLFTLFSQLELETQNNEGTGLGLALVKELAHTMDASTGLDSKLGEGSSFWIQFALYDGESEDKQHSISGKDWFIADVNTAHDDSDTEKVSAYNDNDNISPLILIVDDNADIRALITNKLKATGFRTIAANSGKQALGLVDRHPIELIITDWMMPIMTGPEMIKLIKNDPDKKTIPIILLTARGEDENRTEGIIAGADGYISKPFDSIELVSMTKNLLKLKSLEHSLKIKTLDAIKASELKSTILVNTTHELRTPLNAIIGYGEMLIEDAIDFGNTQIISDLKKIHFSANHLLTLINNLLDMAKIESGHMELCAENFQLQSPVTEAIETIAPLIEFNKNELTISHQDSAMFSDVTKIRQILINLLSNANKFTKSGQIKVDIAIIDDMNGAWIRLEVIDSGIGMDNAQLNFIFSAFTQADSSTTRKYGGTGLGLAITKEYCEMLGGSISVSSDLGKGSRFTVTIPTHLPPSTQQLAS